MPNSSDSLTDQKPKSGLHALYSFTPFRLRETNPYRVILAPISYHNSEPNVHVYGEEAYRSTAAREQFEVSAGGNFAKDVIQPNSLYQWTFDADSDDQVIYQQRNIASPSNWNYRPNHIEYSYESLTDTKYCERGWVIASSESDCPVKRHCPDQENPSSPGGCKYYDPHGRQFSRLYNVQPGIEQHFADPVATDFDQVCAVRYSDMPLFSIGFTTNAQFRAYIDRITFQSNVDWIPSSSVFLQEGLGFTTRNVNALEFRFDQDTLSEFVSDHLSTSQSAHDWLALKYLLYGEDETQVESRNGFDAYDELAEKTATALGGEGSIEDEILNMGFSGADEQSEYAEVVFLHTFAHVLRDRLSVEYGATSDQLQYYIEHPNLSIHNDVSGKVRIVIYEPAISGYGYLDRFKTELAEGGCEHLDDFLENSRNWLEKHSNDIQDELASLPRNLSDEESRLVSPSDSDGDAGDGSDSDGSVDAGGLDPGEVEAIIESIREYMSAFDSTETYPSLRTIRRLIDDDHELSEDRLDVRKLLDRLLKHLPYCWDGCAHCVSAGDDCSMLPFDEPFLISRELGMQTLSTIYGAIEEPGINDLEDHSLLEVVDRHLKFARESITIATPSIGGEYIDQLRSLALDEEHQITLVVENADSIQRAGPLNVSEAADIDETSIVVDETILISGDFTLDDLELAALAANETSIEYAPENAASVESAIQSMGE